MSDARLPTHLEVAALIRAAEGAGGFATVVVRGDRDAGMILLLTRQRGRASGLWERVPDRLGVRTFRLVRESSGENDSALDEVIARRSQRDPDLWVLEVDVANPERLIAALGT